MGNSDALTGTARILVVEDEPGIQELLRITLERAGYGVRCTASSEMAEPILRTWQPQLLILDWMLPGESGLDWCQQLRRSKRDQHIPVIMLTARGEEADRVLGLDAGADDYISKPFSPRELLARVRALLRRMHPADPASLLSAGRLHMDIESHQVHADQQTLTLGPTEFKLLRFFMEQPTRVFSREVLLDRIWGHQVYVETRTVDVHILRLRKALEPAGCDHYVETVRGFGYRFRAGATP